MNPPRATQQNILLGILRVACGKADGLNQFGNTVQSFLASLAPLIAFPLVGAALGIFAEGPRAALTSFAMTLCAVLTPAVLSYELARLWRRGDKWPRFATAFNWCEWTLPVVACLVMVPLSIAMNAGLDQQSASVILLVCLGLYGLWLHLFLVRKGLALSIPRSIAMVLAVNFATVLVVIGPRMLTEHLH